MSDTLAFDLDAYLARIGYSGDRRPSLEALNALHLAHATAIPFENLDILLGRPIRLDIESLQAKLVRDRRGGYCFEHNLLFATALTALGFQVTRLAARVMLNAERVLPRTHMLLLVEIDGQRLLADVGFGAEGLLLPVPFVVGTPVARLDRVYEVDVQDDHYVLSLTDRSPPLALYRFSLEPQLLVDYEVASYFVSTNPNSIFTQLLLAQRIAPGLRHTLRNRELTIDDAGTVTTRAVADDDELLDILASKFDLAFPAGTRFSYREHSA
jgi:N-hydroxyarylamine O-acetyltransferase